MTKFVFIGNQQKKMVKDRESGRTFEVRADPHEQSVVEFTIANRIWSFPKGHPVDVPEDDKELIRFCGKLRNNHHFMEVDDDYKPLAPVNIDTSADVPSQLAMMHEEIERLQSELMAERAKNAMIKEPGDPGDAVVTDEG